MAPWGLNHYVSCPSVASKGEFQIKTGKLKRTYIVYTPSATK